MAQPALREERPEYKLTYNGMPVRYIRDARRGDAGYHPGQPTQVIVEVEVEKSATPYEIRVPAADLVPATEGDPPPEARAWPPTNVPTPYSERREAQLKADEERSHPPPLSTGNKGIDLNLAGPQIAADDDDEEEVEEDEIDHTGKATGKKTTKKVKKSAKK